MTHTSENAVGRNRLVVVAGIGGMADQVRDGFSHWDVVEAGSYLAGIAQAADPGVRAVVVGIDQTPRRIDAAVAGLRAAAGNGVPIVLCCPPHAEPLARRLVNQGADDYLICPPSQEELELALGIPSDSRALDAGGRGAFASVGADELSGLADVLHHLGGGIDSVLQRLADWVCRTLRAAGAEVIAFGHSARRGQAVSRPCLTEGLTDGAELIGRILLGPCREGDYSAGQIEKFRCYARLVGGILTACHREARARCQATTDLVSGLRNRRYLNEFLPSVLERATHQRFRVTLLLFDIDNFKHYNDTYGHPAGDEIIREIGQLMQGCCRRHDVVVRFGGDEFAVVFWDADQPRKAGSQHPSDPLTVVDRFRDALTNHHFPSLGPDARGHLTISGGLATFPWEASNAEELIRRADTALIAAKREGKNRILPIAGGIGGPFGTEASSAVSTEEE
jgi:diguanylate cyclase (GGDEF)-like protein